MNFTRYRGDLTQFTKRLKIADYSTLGLVGVALILSLKIFNTHERIVMTPMKIDEKMEIGWDSASRKYYESSALSAALLIGNINPGNVSFVRDTISSISASGLRNAIRSRLEEDAEIIRRKGQSISFVADNVYFDEKIGKTFVVGRQTVESKTGSKVEEKVSYEFEISIKKGTPEISAYDLYSGVPRDSVWLYGEQQRKESGSGRSERPGQPVPPR